MKVDCLLHVHSSFSYDSRTDLADIAATARAHGFRCVLMSEHNNRLDSQQVAAFVKRCEELSDDRLLIVPGLELAFDQNRVHLLAYGVRIYIDSMGEDCTFAALVEGIHQAGGLAVLAHPSHKDAASRVSLADLEPLDGIEIWNVKNGNRFVPTASDLKLLHRLRRAGGRQFGYGGVDWHHLVNFSPLAIELETETVTWPDIRKALEAGFFRTRGRFVSVPASGDTGDRRLGLYDAAARSIARARRTGYRWQHQLERRGLRTPRALTAIARRLF